MSKDSLELAAKSIISGKSNVVLTGAGISVASGIPDFRSPGGIWDRYDINEYATIEAFYRNPKKVWGFFLEMESELLNKEPNPGHLALAQLEKLGLLDAVITQNIDSLHTKAGSKNVYEVHGSSDRLICTECYETVNRKQDMTEANWVDNVPYCLKCNGLLKSDIVLFGEMLPQDVFNKSVEAVKKTDNLIIAGTSAQVAPVSTLPMIMNRNAKLIEINIEETSLTGLRTDYFLQGRTEKILIDLVDKIKCLLDEQNDRNLIFR